jgi:asparagine synthetase B (glutamine-hydrolysing)
VQGQYAFVAYDGKTKNVFAARDPSGKVPLFYALDDGSGVSFTNQAFEVLGTADAEDWSQLCPGHFMFGRHARVHQFALTPEELYLREYMESSDELSPHAGDSPNLKSFLESHSGKSSTCEMPLDLSHIVSTST